MKRNTARMLLDAVRADRPDWSAEKAAKWITGELPSIRKMLRKHAQDYIRETLLRESLIEDLEE